MRITFPFTVLPTYEEWVNDASVTSAAVVITADERRGTCREQTKERLGERGNKRETWTEEQSPILANMWNSKLLKNQALG